VGRLKGGDAAEGQRKGCENHGQIGGPGWRGISQADQVGSVNRAVESAKVLAGIKKRWAGVNQGEWGKLYQKGENNREIFEWKS